ncbi:MAG TPA: NADH-quinone oxidoreductase subunit A [Candidatus Acidoferrales bacterium]
MPSQYIPIATFALLAAAFPAVCFAVLQRFRGNLRATDRIAELVEREPSTENSPRPAHSLRFSIVAMIYVIFAVAIVFLFPWAIKLSQMGWYGMIVATVFVGILLAGYAWAFRMGALSEN